jgi:hypothetical protein
MRLPSLLTAALLTFSTLPAEAQDKAFYNRESLGSPHTPTPKRHADSAWHVIEARAHTNVRGAAMYVSPHNTHIDMMRAALLSRQTEMTLHISWYDIRSGWNDYLSRTRDWVINHTIALKEHRKTGSLSPRPINAGPLIAVQAYEACDDRIGRDASITEMTTCVASSVLNTASLEISAMIDTREFESREQAGRDITGLKGIALYDVDANEKTMLHELKPGEICKSDDVLTLCSQCTSDFTHLVLGGTDSSTCRDRDNLISISAMIPYGSFMTKAEDLGSPRLALVFNTSNGSDYTLWYRLDGLAEALASERLIFEGKTIGD